MTHAAAATPTLRSPRRRPHGPAAWERACFELLGYRPGERFAIITGLGEAGGAALLALAGARSVSVDNARETLLVRRPAAAQPAPASGYERPLGKVA